MSKHQPPANDHVRLGLDVPASDLSDAELDARIAAAKAAHCRALKLALLRFSEDNAARLNAQLEEEGRPSEG
jgi:hypothetical protein